ncbi:alpha/beta hydrolase [Salinicoccus sp. CNSTN-B1]
MWKWETDKRPKGVVLVIHDMMEHHDYYTGLIAQLRKDGYHVVTGDLPGHGQTTRMNKGHISDFAQYLDRVKEWHEVARAYRLPTFILGQGLGGLIAIETLRRNMVRADGLIVLNPLLAFKQSFINRKNTIRSSIRMGSDAHRFDPGLEPGYFTTDKNIWSCMRMMSYWYVK